jgi:hypothetical protein
MNLKRKPSEVVVLFAVFIMLFLCYCHLCTIIDFIKELTKEQKIINKETAYYKCGGSKKKPIFCEIQVKEEIHENN